MVLFGKKTKEPQTTKAQQQAAEQEKKTRLSPYEIHVMPEKFRATETAPRKGGAKKWAIIAVIVFVIVIGVSAAIYFLTTPQPTMPPGGSISTAPVPPQSPKEPLLGPEITKEPEQSTTSSPSVSPPSPSRALSGAGGEEGVPPALMPTPTLPKEVVLESTVDTDSDRLTNTEEILYQTETRVKDTDGDGFDDGTEIINGFNPKSSGTRLADSGLVNSYHNPLFNYTVLHPASWLARATDQSLTEVIFQSTTGEFVRISTIENPGQQSLLDYYLEQAPEANPAELRQKNTAEGLGALVTPNGLEYFMGDPNDLSVIYHFEYEIGNRTKLNFLTTFEMMTNNFSV